MKKIVIITCSMIYLLGHSQYNKLYFYNIIVNSTMINKMGCIDSKLTQKLDTTQLIDECMKIQEEYYSEAVRLINEAEQILNKKCPTLKLTPMPIYNGIKTKKQLKEENKIRDNNLVVRLYYEEWQKRINFLTYELDPLSYLSKKRFLPELLKQNKQISDSLLYYLKNRNEFKKKNIYVANQSNYYRVLAMIDLPQWAKDTILFSNNVPIEVLTKLGDAKAEAELIRRFELLAIDSSAYNDNFEDYTYKLFYASTNLCWNAYFKALQSNHMKKFRCCTVGCEGKLVSLNNELLEYYDRYYKPFLILFDALAFKVPCSESKTYYHTLISKYLSDKHHLKINIISIDEPVTFKNINGVVIKNCYSPKVKFEFN